MKTGLIETINKTLYLFESDYFKILPNKQRSQYTPNNFIAKLFKVFKIFLKDVYFSIIGINKIKKDSIWLFTISQNNYNTLSTINSEKLGPAQFLYPKQSLSLFPFENHCTPIYLKRKLLLDILFPFFLLAYLVNSNRKRVYIKHFDLLFEAFGCYFSYIYILNNNKPKAIIFSNDHLIHNRSLLFAAKKLNIKTIYIQHASINTKAFPPLEFSLSLLEGLDTLNKYKKIGKVEGKVALVGMPKFDKYAFKIKATKEFRTIAICYNTLDEIKDVKKLYYELDKSFPKMNLVLRAHPNDKRDMGIKNANYSEAEKELSFDFFQEVDISISSNSSIHLEAILLNIPSIYYQFTDFGYFDYYEYVENHLVEYAATIEDVIVKINMLIKNPISVQHRAKYYNEVIDTKYYGKSTDLTIEKIINFLENETSISKV